MPECMVELKDIRRSLLEDYRLSPAVEEHCKPDVKYHCDGVATHDVIHCLMDVARHQYKAAADGRKQLSDECYSEVSIGSTIR